MPGTDVQQKDLRRKGGDQLQCGGAIVGDLHFVLVQPQHRCQGLRAVDVIVHDQHSAARRTLMAQVGTSDCRTDSRRLGCARQPDGEFAPLSRTRAVGDDRAAVHGNQGLHDRQADPPSPLGRARLSDRPA